MAEYYINADSGDNSTGDGSVGSPWETLAYAYDQSSADDTITCQDSTAVYDFVDDTFDHSITIQGEQEDASGAVFDGNSANARWILDAANITVQKITVKDTYNASHIRGLLNFTANCSVVNFLDCKFQDNDIYMSSGYGGLFSTSGIPTLTAPVAFNVKRCLIDDPISGVAGTSIFGFRTGGGAKLTVTVEECTIYLERVVDYISMIVRSGYIAAQYIEWDWKNTITSNENGQVVTTQNDQKPTYSDFHNVTVNVGLGTGCITSDPLFVDRGNKDFNLDVPTSPCINTGTLV